MPIKTLILGGRTRSSGLDFKDRSPKSPSPGYPFPGQGNTIFVPPTSQQQMHDGVPVPLTPAPLAAHAAKHRVERERIQPLMRAGTRGKDDGEEGGKWGMIGKIKVWMVNEGGKRMFFGVFVLLHLIVMVFGLLNYQLKDNLTNARASFGVTYPIARSAALVLHVDVMFILFPVCRNFISLLRRTPLNSIIPFDKNITFHKAVAWSMVFFTLVHIVAHMVNFARFGINTGTGFKGFLLANFATGPGLTGWFMTIFLGIMVFFAMEKRRRAHFERFWYSHHLFVPFFVLWQFHGMFCMIQPDRPPYCSWTQIGSFWKFWLAGGVIWICERILREVRSRHVTYISKVIQHPSQVVEVQIKKERTTTRAGQYIFLNCPEVSHFQWHPFTLTSAPEEDYISVHIRVVGDFTKAFAKSVGCDFEKKDAKGEKSDVTKVIGTAQNPPLNRILPRVMIDGPFGSASEDFLNYEVALLVGGGIGVTPFASILKSIWYRMNNFSKEKPTRLSKVYFVWVIRDFGMAEWFHSLLHAIEEQDTDGRIEINIYLTQKMKEDDMNNILVHEVGADRDAITALRAPTHYGRPNWDRVFQGIVDRHQDTDCGVFFCGPPPIGKDLHKMSNKYTHPTGTRFFFGKENF